MKHPAYQIQGPAQICFSRGRTSGYMLHQILEASDGLPQDCHVTFENTGQEREETLVFVEECSRRWHVPVRWLEWGSGQGPGGFRRPEWRYVDFGSASRKGEPFARLIAQKRYLPNVRHRLCTSNLKVRVGEAFMRSPGYQDWDSVLGIRADEPRRVARMLAPGRDNSAGLPCLPLVRADVTKADVLHWWSRQPFNLALDPAGDLGNCDLCFLKGRRKLVSALRADRTRVVWWLDQEHLSGQRFLTGYDSYADLLREADFLDRQLELDGLEPPDLDHESTAPLADCRCGD